MKKFSFIPQGRTAAGLAAMLALAALPAGAQNVIPLTNASFETQVLADNGFTTSAPTGWSTTLGAAGMGAYNPLDSQYTGSTGADIPSPATGKNAFYVNMAATEGFNYIKQDTGHTIVAGETYTMTVAVGGRGDKDFAADQIKLRLGYNFGTQTYLTTIVDTDFAGTGNLTGGQFTDFTVAFTALAGQPYIGQSLAVLIGAADGNDGVATSVDFDNVRLTVTPPPAADFMVTITPNAGNPGNYDFAWNSLSGKVYDLVTSTDLATPISTWAVWQGHTGIAADIDGINELTNVPGGGDTKRFFAVVERAAP